MRWAWAVMGWMLGLAACGDTGSGNTHAGGIGGYFMAVFTMPSGDAAADTSYPYSVQLNIPGNANAPAQDGNAALTAAVSPRDPINDQPEWRARMAFEGHRRAQIDAVAAEQSLWGLAWPGPVRTAGSCSGVTCNGNSMCWKGTCTSTPSIMFIDGTTTLNCNVVAVLPVPGKSVQINVVMDGNNTTADQANQAVAATQQFISTFAAELQILGQTDHTGAVDIDGDGRLTLVYSSENGNSDDNQFLAGFFSASDAVATTANGIQTDGNVADLLWARIPGTTLGTGTAVTPALLAGTMAHEYTHLTSFALRVLGGTQGREDLWLDEGMAHTMEDLTGWSVSTATVYATALQNWGKGGFASSTDSVEQRGRAYALVRYVIDQQAKVNNASDAASSAAQAAATTVMSALVHESDLGFLHPVFANLGQPGVFNWLTALYVSGNSDANTTAAHTYDYLPTGTNSTTNNLIGFNPRGSSYKDASGNTVDMPGPATDDLDASSSDPSGTALDESASVLFAVSGFDPNHVAEGEGASANVGPFLQVVQVSGAAE